MSAKPDCFISTIQIYRMSLAGRGRASIMVLCHLVFSVMQSGLNIINSWPPALLLIPPSHHLVLILWRVASPVLLPILVWLVTSHPREDSLLHLLSRSILVHQPNWPTLLCLPDQHSPPSLTSQLSPALLLPFGPCPTCPIEQACFSWTLSLAHLIWLFILNQEVDAHNHLQDCIS